MTSWSASARNASAYDPGMLHPASATQCVARSRQAWIATKRFRTTMSRASRSRTNAASVAGRFARTRAVASLTDAILAATSALSTTRHSSAEDTGRAEFFHGLEIEIVEDRTRLACDQRRVIPLDDDLPVAKNSVGEGRRGFVEQHEVDVAPDGRPEMCHQP